MGQANTQVLEHAISELAKRYDMTWRMFYDNQIKRVALMVSKLDHCLYDLLIRLKAGELSCHVPIIISNHPDLAPIAEQFGIPFRYCIVIPPSLWPAEVLKCDCFCNKSNQHKCNAFDCTFQLHVFTSSCVIQLVLQTRRDCSECRVGSCRDVMHRDSSA